VPPPTRYATSIGDAAIAYQVHGSGPIDVVLLTGQLSNVETLWEEPGLARLFDRLAGWGRLVLMDQRGVGMSDRIERLPTPEEMVADIEAVLDAAGSERAALLGTAGGAAYVMHFAVERPERTRALVLYGTFARTTRSDELPWATPPEERAARVRHLSDHWGEGLNADVLAASVAGDPGVRAWFARLERTALSPRQSRVLAEQLADLDVSHLLPRITVPTLLLHRTHDTLIDVRHSRYMAERIPGAQLVELPGVDHLMSVGDTTSLMGEIEEFLTGERSLETQRALLTVLFTDICDGTARAAEIGDGRWRDLLAAHDAEVRRQLVRFGGREVKTIGDGFLAVFDGPPSPAVRCARALVDATAGLGVPLRAGLHTGECELIGDDIGGMAVHIAARVSALAGPGEVLASGTTYGTVVGSGLPFEEVGMRELRGVPGPWPVFRVG
jgi:pimeloyl-ACP methyl ester carboxylesterase